MTTPGGALVVIVAKDGTRLYWEATWRHAGHAHKRRLGEAWVRPRAATADVKGWNAKYEKRPGNPRGDELTPQQATVVMRDLIVAHAAAAPVAGRPRTFREAAAAWLDDPYARSHAWTPETHLFNRGMLAEPGADERRGRILRAFGDTRVDRIIAEDVRKYLRGLDNKVAPRTVNAHRQVLASVFADAAARGWRSGNPATDVAKRRQPAAPALEVFTSEQVDAIALAAEGELGALIIVAAMTGLRRGELVALRWRDVRFEQPALHVERAVSDGQIRRPKSARPASFRSPTGRSGSCASCPGVPIGRTPTTLCSLGRTAACATPTRSARRTSACATPLALPRCGSTICVIRSARCSRAPASRASTSRPGWGTRPT